MRMGSVGKEEEFSRKNGPGKDEVGEAGLNHPLRQAGCPLNVRVRSDADFITSMSDAGRPMFMEVAKECEAETMRLWISEQEATEERQGLPRRLVGLHDVPAIPAIPARLGGGFVSLSLPPHGRMALLDGKRESGPRLKKVKWADRIRPAGYVAHGWLTWTLTNARGSVAGWNGASMRTRSHWPSTEVTVSVPVIGAKSVMLVERWAV